MNKYLIFRTDRIGDFLLTAILINSIKRNNPQSYIIVVASENNYDYIKSFKNIDEVLLLKKNFLSKLILFKNLLIHKFNSIIVHDGKNRSNFITFFLKSNLKIYCKPPGETPYIAGIIKILNTLKFNFLDDDFNMLNDRPYDNKFVLNDKFILLHFDEKWVHKKYISSYLNIEPSEKELILFLKSIVIKTKKNLVVTTGSIPLEILNSIFSANLNKNIFFYNNLNFIELESIVDKCDLLVACHGAISHVASAKNIKQIDIIEKNKINFYKKWTSHFRNYNFIYRKNFSDLSKEIISNL